MSALTLGFWLATTALGSDVSGPRSAAAEAAHGLPVPSAGDAQAPQATSTLSIVAFGPDGGTVAVEVRVDDVRALTPATLAVAPGSHTLFVVSPAGPWLHRDLVTRPGEFVDVVVDVDRDVARLDVLSDVLDPAAVVLPSTLSASEDASSTTPTATLQFRVRSLADDRPLADARVDSRGGGMLGQTDNSGALTAVVPVGRRALSVTVVGFVPRIVEVDVVGDETRVVEIGLLPMADELDEMTVRAPQIRGGLVSAASERREQKQLVEVLGAEQMKKSGDGDAASALRRVTGLTVVGGRFVYVRGLGDRYSSTLVNGAVLPSPEPERRVVPLDLFPSALLESLVVQKTWSPDLPGEFGGGSVQLRTRTDPRAGGDKPLLSFGLSTGALLGTTFTTRAMTPVGRFDLLAADDGSRAVPAAVIDASRNAPIAEGNALTGGGLDKKALEKLGEQFSPVWSPKASLALPALGASATLGDTFATPLGRLGAIAALTWNTDTSSTTTSRQLVAGSANRLVVTDDVQIAANERSVAWGGVLGLAWAPATGQELRAVTLLNRAADDEARVVDGHDDDTDARLRLVRLRYVARQLFVQQLAGAHGLPWMPFSEALRLDWRAGYSLAQREEPGQRIARYDETADGRMLLSDRSDGNQILSSALVDHAIDTRVAVRVPFSVGGGEPAHVDLGMALTGKLRTVDTRRFKFLFAGPRAADVEVRAQAADAIFVPGNIGGDGFLLAESTRNTDNHNGSSMVFGSFVTAEVPVWPDVVVSGGLRIEASRLQVTTFELFNAAAPPVVAELVNVDLLPALSLAWTFADDLTWKAAVARTVVRPELRELSPALYTDVAGSRARFGNPALRETTVSHVDARLEWALSPRDGASVAVFAKHFADPIESVVSPGSDQAITAANVDAALNVGAEVDGRVALVGAIPALATMPVLDNLWLGGNFALIASRVFIGVEQQGTLTSSERPLEGQSPWVANAQVGWDDDSGGGSVVALYNVFGPRIVEVGALGLPDAIEQPFHQIDVVVRQRLPAGFVLGAKAGNVLDLPATRTLDGRVVDHVNRGRTISASLSWTW
jgi:hypothetical protein